MEQTNVTTNEVLNVKLDYIQQDLKTIKGDVKDIKADYVSRREFETQLKDMEGRDVLKFHEISEKVNARFGVIEKRVDDLYRLVYWFIGIFGVATIGAITKIIFR